MQTWIFQGDPDEFDLDGYLASRPGQVPWLVTRYASEIAVGDHVYVWRNQGTQRVVGRRAFRPPERHRRGSGWHRDRGASRCAMRTPARCN